MINEEDRRGRPSWANEIFQAGKVNEVHRDEVPFSSGGHHRVERDAKETRRPREKKKGGGFKLGGSRERNRGRGPEKGGFEKRVEERGKEGKGCIF